MPPQPIIADWLRLVVHVAHEGNTMLYIYNYRHDSGEISESNLQQFCQQFWAQNGSRLAGWSANTYTFTLVECTDRSAVGGAYGNYIPLTSTVGTASGDATPANVASCISLRTGRSGRSFHGRQYAFGFTDSHLTGSNITGGIVASLGTYAQGLISYAFPGPITATLCVASIKHLALYPINGFALDAIADSQRRRLPGRGY